MIIKADQYHNYFHLKKLLEIKDTPKQLYIEGNVELLNASDYKILCIVGSRKNTSYGRDVVEYITREIASDKIIILSGLALGIDGIAHKEALRNNIPTIAIPGSGLGRDILHPQTNVQLANDIVAHGGLLISEYENDFKATIWSFPKRNRVEAALSDALIIVESEAKSGTQITARLALEYNKNIGIVPGSIFSPMSVGTINLWHEGATPIAKREHVLDILNIKYEQEPFPDGGLFDNNTNINKNNTNRNNNTKKTYNGNNSKNTAGGNDTQNSFTEINLNNLNDHEKIIIYLIDEPKAKDIIISQSGLEFTEALVALIMLEGKGYIKEEFGEIRRIR